MSRLFVSFPFIPAALCLAGIAAAQNAAPADWLVKPSGFTAKVSRDEAKREVSLENGLVRRTFRVTPNLATVAYDNLTTGASIIRAIQPEAKVTIDGREYAVGGLTGQPNRAFFTDEQLAAMKADPAAMRFIGMNNGKPEATFAWKQVRHHAPDATWPPKGVSLRFDFAMPAENAAAATGKTLWADDFLKLDPAWKIVKSSAEERVSFINEGKAGEIYAPFHVHCFAERALPPAARAVEAVLDPGTDRATSWGMGFGLVDAGGVTEVCLRPGDRGEHGHFELRENGREKLASVKEFAAADGGLSTEVPYRLRARLDGDVVRWEAAAQREPLAWKPLFTTPKPASPWTSVRVGKTGRDGGASDAPDDKGDWGRGRVIGVTVTGEPEEAPAPAANRTGPIVSVHYELYDNLPLIVKWLTVENRGKEKLRVDRFTAETLAMVEQDNHVDSSTRAQLPPPDSLLVTTDMAFGNFDRDFANAHAVHYRPDKSFKTQVNYLLESPCLLEVEPERGPAQDVEPGGSFTSFRVFELATDGGNRERRGLAYRKMMRTVAPWVTENPLMMHMRNAQPEKVREAIDQCVEVGFEMVILSFGSGFNAENDSPEYLAKWKEVADYAKSKGIELGCYSLYASRSVGGGNDIVAPPGEKVTFGNCPAITSAWGQSYLRKLSAIFDATGFSVFEHDGPYPGDTDVTPRPPLQKGIDDSQWVHWRTWSDFYRTLRSKGVYINAPDYYYHQGSNKCGMGYREVNWSLPRAQQLIHTRQNIHDGTWEKTPSMGWMFVPLSEYQGGGAAATIEPLDTHIDHYERMLLSNLALGVQACYRGPRLFDTPRVRDMLKRHVAWFKANRDLLESDLIHLRRADGRALDGMLHVNPALGTPAMLCVFNPAERELVETWTVPLYYAGLGGAVTATDADGKATKLQADGQSRVRHEVRVPAGGFRWITYRKS